MTWLAEAARKAARMLLPWPSRRERREAIASAEREKRQSRAAAAHAAQVEASLRRMAETNHFADAIAEQLARRHR